VGEVFTMTVTAAIEIFLARRPACRSAFFDSLSRTWTLPMTACYLAGCVDLDERLRSDLTPTPSVSAGDPVFRLRRVCRGHPAAKILSWVGDGTPSPCRPDATSGKPPATR